MIILNCTNCHAVLEMDEAFAGGVCRCRHCGAIQTVPLHLKHKKAIGDQKRGRTLYSKEPAAEPAARAPEPPPVQSTPVPPPPVTRKLPFLQGSNKFTQKQMLIAAVAAGVVCILIIVAIVAFK